MPSLLASFNDLDRLYRCLKMTVVIHFKMATLGTVFSSSFLLQITLQHNQFEWLYLMLMSLNYLDCF